jgi:hypothetical protein
LNSDTATGFRPDDDDGDDDDDDLDDAMAMKAWLWLASFDSAHDIQSARAATSAATMTMRTLGARLAKHYSDHSTKFAGR